MVIKLIWEICSSVDQKPRKIFSNIIFAFMYNKLYIKDLVSSGFKAKSVANGDIDTVINQLGIIIPKL